MEYTNMKTEELIKMKIKIENAIEEELKKRSGKVTLKLRYNLYKGTGKCWVAVIDPVTKEKRGFLNPISVNKDSAHAGEKILELQEGQTYMINEMGTKTRDTRKIILISEGQIKEVL